MAITSRVQGAAESPAAATDGDAERDRVLDPSSLAGDLVRIVEARARQLGFRTRIGPG